MARPASTATIKTDDRLDLQALHRVRERLVSRRTAVINQVRAFLQERGITFRKGPASLRKQLLEILENAGGQLSGRMRGFLAMLRQEWKELEQQIGTKRMFSQSTASAIASASR